MSPDLFTRLTDTIVATGPVAALLLIAVWHATMMTAGGQRLGRCAYATGVTPSEDQGGNSVW